MHRLIIAGALVGGLVLISRSSKPAAGGVPSMVPNTQSTYDARTKAGPYRIGRPGSDPLWMSFDARRYPVRVLPPGIPWWRGMVAH